MVRRGGLFLTWVMWFCAVVSPGWAAPLYGRPGTYAVDGSPVGIGAGAIDTQPGRDLVTANEAGAEGPSLSILFNRGQGSFFPEQRVNVDASKYILHAVAVGDFNADGAADLAAAVDDVTAFPIRASVLVYLNDGTGAFARPTEYKLNGFFPRCIAAGDVTADGALDLAIGFAQSGGSRGLFTVLAGQRANGAPNGAFAATTTTVVGAAPSAIDLGDIDGDAHVDALVADRDAGMVFALYGTGDAAAPVAAPVAVTSVTAPVAALIDAVPGRTLPQVLVAGRNSGRLLTLVQGAPRTFAAPLEQRIGFLPAAMALADVDDDGVDDLVVVSVLGAELWTGAEDGSFAFGESIVDDDSLDAVTVADLNGDGRPDIAASASTQDRVTVVLYGADVPFTPAPTATVTPTSVSTSTPTPGPADCAGDCNGDGQVSINELIQGVNIALGNAAASTCVAFDRDDNGQVTVNELIAGVNSALGGCPAAT